MRVPAGLLCFLAHALTAHANVEKTIFHGPRPITLTNARPGLEDLRTDSLDPANSIVLATQLPVQFPTKSAPHGLESWYFLDGLEDGRRYEVRVCWPATQPTDFWLETFSIAQVFDNPHLISSLTAYSEQRPPLSRRSPLQSLEKPSPSQSILLLRIQAAASYYSPNRTLMESPPPVHVDIILDPFLLNVLPRSLGPTAIYITIVFVGAWFLSDYIYRWLLSAIAEIPEKPHTD